LDDAKLRARTTYDAAADFYDHAALGFWDRFGRATVDRLDLAPGAAVLDVCAGTGASALPAAVRVGPTGRVVAVDLAENQLASARRKAERAGLANLELRHGDLDAFDEGDGSFDAVVIVFGIFFLPDMAASARRLWRKVRPGGALAVTTWGPRLFEPANSIFWDAVSAVRPDLTRAYSPWDSLSDPRAVEDLLRHAAGETVAVPVVEVHAVAGRHPLAVPDDFWAIVRGSGYRATCDAMTAGEQAAVRARTIAALTREGVTSIETNVVYGKATRVTP